VLYILSPLGIALVVAVIVGGVVGVIVGIASKKWLAGLLVGLVLGIGTFLTIGFVTGLISGVIYYAVGSGSTRAAGPPPVAPPVAVPVAPVVPASPPVGKVWAWHGRQGRGEASGFNVEFIVEYPVFYVGTLEWWASIDGRWDQWGNDSLKGIEPSRTWRDAMASFPNASWLDLPANVVREHDEGGPNGQSWTMAVSSNVPVGFDWIMNNGHVVNIQVTDDAGNPIPGVRVIRWVVTDDFPY